MNKKPCTHTHSYWAGIIRTCPHCGDSYGDPKPGVEIIDQKTIQVGKVSVTTTFGRITPRKAS